MKKFIGSVLTTTLILGGCSAMENESNKDTNTETKSVPEEMEASKYVGQGFQPPAEKDAVEFAKKHKDKIAKRGEQFFMDNFGLKVKATNVVGSGDGVEVFVHCDDHDIVFNASIPFDKSIIESDSSLRSEDKGDDMSTLVGTVLSGFEYRTQKEKYDNLYKFFKDNEEKYQYTGFTKEAINKTQNSGYENEYFYIVANIPTLQEYRKYYEPLIKKNNLNFKKGMKQARKGVGYKAAIEVHTTLFSRSSNFSKDKKLDDVIDLSESTKKLHLNFENTKIFLQLAKSTISTNRVNYSDNESIRIEVE
ncbi:DUF1672 domain-containing protein [Staphylococcus aureus]|uniref:DUF1672 domain-containing protein n=1 Tax=Staphylococcus aureus TaxID=1280 RepID=UPI001CD7903E|nr:DUF1672 domain-containing protein [Staphylococcus aureus]MCH4748754.1 DUF1672 domain-containing protein [Staphylococcus aureus]MCH4789633.1 DUF1672 domain-containing protein [Staphylococcus aureus]MCH4792946.1 DUF1672 domain-containing protein [Staphylococcus aureus]USK89237.1 DUF1672 domain-containing protein [Staphylococcus aureus]HCU8011005.1 DUF1672 domain-containing protein [Staphylococcus aureus]